MTSESPQRPAVTRSGSLLSAPVISFIAGRAASSLGNNSTFVIVAFAVLSIGGSAADIGIVLAVAAVPKVVFLLLGGVAGDRFSRRAVLLTSDLLMFAVQAATAVLFLAGAATIWSLAVLQAVGGVVSAFASPAQSGVLPLISPPGALQRANASFRLVKTVASIAGPAVGGVLLAISNPGVGFAFDAATFLISGLAMLALPRVLPRSETTPGIINDLREGWKAVISRPWISWMIGTFSVYQATMVPAIYVLGPLSAPAPQAQSWAAVLVFRSIGSLVAASVMLKWRPTRPLLSSNLLLLFDVPFIAVLALKGDLPLLLAAAVISSGAVTAADILWETSMQEGVPENVLSRVSSYDWLGSLAFAPVGYLLIGYASDAVDIVTLLFIILGIHVALRLAVALVPAIRSVQSARGQDPRFT